MLDRDRVLAKVEELEGYVDHLARTVPATLEEYKADINRRLVIERLLHISIECLLDLSDLFVRGLRLGLPDSESGILERLEESGVLDREDVRLIREMQKFRNVLVHRYGSLDAARVHANALRGTEEFRRLGRAFRTALDTGHGRGGGKQQKL